MLSMQADAAGADLAIIKQQCWTEPAAIRFLWRNNASSE